MSVLKAINKIIFTRRSRAFFLAPQIRTLTREHEEKQFVDKPTPYQREARKCLLCRHEIELSYKNPRLLSQFVSSLNGNIYDKHITGLCQDQHVKLVREIKKSRDAALMPIYHKDPRFNKDPPLFDPDRPQRPNPY